MKPVGRQQSIKAPQSLAIRYYLILYNLLSTIGWTYVFVATVAHLSGATVLSRVMPPPAASTATSSLTRLWNAIPFMKSSPSVSASVGASTQAWLPSALEPLLIRAKTTFIAVGSKTALVQSFAALEVLHSLLQWVRSPIATTSMQVASRLILVWGITEKFESARENPLYASMVVAWSMTEIIRYSLYASNLLQYEPRRLMWLRYTTFIVLYPLGAGSEAALIFSTLPPCIPPCTGSWTLKNLGGWLTQRVWGEWEYVRAALFLLWWPGLYIMYTHMMQQRRKVLGGSRLEKRKTI